MLRTSVINRIHTNVLYSYFKYLNILILFSFNLHSVLIYSCTHVNYHNQSAGELLETKTSFANHNEAVTGIGASSREDLYR